MYRISIYTLILISLPSSARFDPIEEKERTDALPSPFLIILLILTI